MHSFGVLAVLISQVTLERGFKCNEILRTTVQATQQYLPCRVVNDTILRENAYNEF
jgi:hypothetical protein